MPGVDLAAEYAAAGEGNEVGGDFYDVFAVAEDHWRFAIGDVCGTGPEAAAVTGLARYTMRILAREGRGVAEVLERLNRLILDEGPRARFITLVHGEIITARGGRRRLQLDWLHQGRRWPGALAAARVRLARLRTGQCGGRQRLGSRWCAPVIRCRCCCGRGANPSLPRARSRCSGCSTTSPSAARP